MMKKLIKILPLFSLILIACTTTVKEAQIPQKTDTYTTNWMYQPGEGKDSLWMNPGYNDSHWQEVTSTQTLKEQNVPTGNGFGWYRKTITLSDELKDALSQTEALVLKLGKLAAVDETWFNGHLIGKTGEFPPDYKGYNSHPRKYLVPGHLVNTDGENVIAIKFNNGWGEGGFLDDVPVRLVSASTNDKIKLDVQVMDDDFIFLSPDPLEITVNIQNKNKWPVEGTLIIELLTDDYRPLKKDSVLIKIKSEDSFTNKYDYPSPEPGFYRYNIQFVRQCELVCEEKFNVGFEPEKIASPIDSKENLRGFWEKTLYELAKVPPRYKLTHLPEHSQLDYDMYLVEMYSFGNELIRGYYAKPKKEGQHPVIVEYMGYGSAPYTPNQSWDGFAYFVLSIRGQALNQPANKYGTWITYGLDNKDNYYYRGAFMDVIRALDFVSSRPEIESDKIAVRGGSQGGALSFVASALDNRVKVAAPSIPFLSDYRDYFKITHWPREDFERYIEQHPEANWEDIYDLLAHFDIKNLAQWIQCPLIMGIGVQDEVCPPHINFAAYNQVPAEKIWMAFPDFGHSVGKEYYEASMTFIKEKLQVK